MNFHSSLFSFSFFKHKLVHSDGKRKRLIKFEDGLSNGYIRTKWFFFGGSHDELLVYIYTVIKREGQIIQWVYSYVIFQKISKRNDDCHRQFTYWTITKKYCLSITGAYIICWEAAQTINYGHICKHVDFFPLLFFRFLFSNTSWNTLMAKESG